MNGKNMPSHSHGIRELIFERNLVHVSKLENEGSHERV
ncbi:hypothetical protein LEP1GSC120_0904 [Leptospira santarosai str. 200702252]|nr:hypothetical protein LEP1GSC130_1949 [Leptospira santarosai str. 200403458]EMO98139.1 hypothetical protein LEP1GSC120_0904 [Leptospira santarosai str. 200702252]